MGQSPDPSCTVVADAQRGAHAARLPQRNAPLRTNIGSETMNDIVTGMA